MAKINGLGLLTWLSQDALSRLSKEPNFGERSYVSGHMPLDKAREFSIRFNIDHDDMLATLTIPIPADMLRTLIAEGRYQGITNREIDEDTGEWKIRGAMPSIDDERIWKHYGTSLVGVHVVDLKWGRSATSKKGLWRAIIQVLNKLRDEEA